VLTKIKYECGDLIKFWAWSTKKGDVDWNGCSGQVIPVDERIARSRIGVVIRRMDHNQYEILSCGKIIEVCVGYFEKIF